MIFHYYLLFFDCRSEFFCFCVGQGKELHDVDNFNTGAFVGSHPPHGLFCISFLYYQCISFPFFRIADNFINCFSPRTNIAPNFLVNFEFHFQVKESPMIPCLREQQMCVCVSFWDSWAFSTFNTRHQRFQSCLSHQSSYKYDKRTYSRTYSCIPTVFLQVWQTNVLQFSCCLFKPENDKKCELLKRIRELGEILEWWTAHKEIGWAI